MASRKPAKKAKSKGRKKSELKAPKRRRFVKGLIDGKSMRKAAVDAGYTQSMADNAGEKILPGAVAEFKEALAKAVPDEILIKRLAEGLNAKETKLVQYRGEYSDQRHLVAYSERRRSVELVAKLRGLLIERVEVGNSDDKPLKVEVGIARDKLLGKLASQ
jgi:hypothetical protein